MNTRIRQFQLSAEPGAEAIVDRISSDWLLSEPEEESVNRIFYDSFDWRLYTGERLLQARREGRGQILEWLDAAAGERLARLSLAGKMPKFCWDLPRGALRDELSSLLEMRALLPQVELRSRIRTLAVLDDEQKTVARIALESHAAREPGSRSYRDMPGRLRLFSVRGYEAAFEQITGLLQQELGICPVSDGLLSTALATVGRSAGDYTSKLNFKFKPGAPAAVTARQIHLHLLGTMERNLPGTLADLDSEFLHDLRVAVRRARSALTQIKGVFPPQEVERFKPELAWIGQITGESRDMDVYLLDYDRYRASLPDRFRSDLDPLHDFLITHQKSAYRRMVRQLNSERFKTLLAEWRSFLELAPAADGEAPAASMPVADMADRRIYRIYKRVLTEGGVITDDSPAEALHELRKNCKKLRYLMEFFQSLYPGREVRPRIKALKVLLDNLGLFQDLEVQADKLRHFAHQMVKEGEVPADTLLAMGMLVDGLLRRQSEVRHAFGSRFAEFAGRENRTAFKNLFSGSARVA